MSLCGACRHTPIRTQTPPTLFEIRQGYRARWRDLTLSVEADFSQWTLRVHDSASDATLYTAHRSSARAARLTAAEFAAFREFGGAVSPDQISRELSWQPYW